MIKIKNPMDDFKLIEVGQEKVDERLAQYAREDKRFKRKESIYRWIIYFILMTAIIMIASCCNTKPCAAYDNIEVSE